MAGVRASRRAPDKPSTARQPSHLSDFIFHFGVRATRRRNRASRCRSDGKIQAVARAGLSGVEAAQAALRSRFWQAAPQGPQEGVAKWRLRFSDPYLKSLDVPTHSPTLSGAHECGVWIMPSPDVKPAVSLEDRLENGSLTVAEILNSRKCRAPNSTPTLRRALSKPSNGAVRRAFPVTAPSRTQPAIDRERGVMPMKKGPSGCDARSSKAAFKLDCASNSETAQQAQIMFLGHRGLSPSRAALIAALVFGRPQ